MFIVNTIVAGVAGAGRGTLLLVHGLVVDLWGRHVFCGSERSGQDRKSIPMAGRNGERHRGPVFCSSTLIPLAFAQNQAAYQGPWGSHTPQVTHTLHVDVMACVENCWQTSNGGAVQENQDCTIYTSGDQTRALKAQRRGRWRGGLGITQGSRLASRGLECHHALRASFASHGVQWHCFSCFG